ncbi:MAG: dihydrolipoyl dehydrogenase [Gammaproteobacteria bacterium]|nr:dihydrolipoyl dehydrogenase [Gammaproteobacteria bacterium]
MSNYDVVVIGAGPGGYVAAIRAAQLGLTTACVDRWAAATGHPSLGGTCLNVGCIPSKALLDTSHHYHAIQHAFPAHGITAGDVQLDLAKAMARKNKVVANLTRGIRGLFRKNKIDLKTGTGALLPDKQVEVRAADGTTQTLTASNIIIATGSAPITIAVAPVDGVNIVDNEGALAFDEIPSRLGIIGAGVIGLELGSVWSRFGSQVVILEALDDFLAAADRQISQQALKALKKQGLDIRLGCRVTGTQVTDGGVRVAYNSGEGEHTLEVDKLIVAVGRCPATDGLDADAAGLALDPQGRIAVDRQCRTNIEGIYAVGDVVAGPMLAHKASEEGIAVAELIAGQKPEIDHALVPWVVYTHPEIAWVGASPQQLDEQGIEYKSGTFPYMGLGRAQGAGQTDGLVKILAAAHSDRILGVHIFGANASELIGEAVTAMAFHASAEDLARIIHAHPTLSEAVHEAALAVDGRAIHI